VGYHIRILGTNITVPSFKDLQQTVEPAILEVSEGTGDDWETLILKHDGGDEIAVIEKNPVIAGELGADELEEFIEEVGEYKPASAVDWLSSYLRSVKVIYAFQFLGGTETENGFELLQKLYAAIWNSAGGILQADGEGFSNESGNTILWQFSDHVTGDWNVAVLDPDKQWIDFEMDLGNQKHREAFWRGEVPAGAKLI